jgi:SAM-dependent methyltransferase
MGRERPIPTEPGTSDRHRVHFDLFVISGFLMYLEVACIRWLPAHVLYLTFFTNTVLLASFLGMSLGCLAAKRRSNLLTSTPALLLGLLLAGQAVSFARDPLERVVRVGDSLAPEVIFFGTEYASQDPTRIVVPIEVVAGLFFVLVALVLSGPGQELGRAFNRVPDRLRAYSLNVAGSLVGLGLFTLCSWFELPPVAWFLPVVAGLSYLLLARPGFRLASARPDVLPALGLILAVAFWTSGDPIRWSPYYRVDYHEGPPKAIAVNLIGHQVLVSKDDPDHPAHAYAVPHLLNRDAGGRPFADVLVIGAGTGNDVSRALAWGARRVDAVEIDPVIQRLGARDHPDRPYDDPRVSVHIDDGRNFLRTATGQYDLIVFALVDSLVLHSGYSNLRLESFMFTDEAMADVRARLKPDGVFVMYNLFRRGWIVARLHDGLRRAFHTEPLVFTLPFVDAVTPDAGGGFTILMVGRTDPIRDAFGRHDGYWLETAVTPSPASPNGFTARGQAEARNGEWLRVGPAEITSSETLAPATDDWPFLYLRQPMLPLLTLRGIVIMGAAAAVLLVIFAPAGAGGPRDWALDGRMFFLGAGFMLVETKAVVEMALLFGSTWLVNSIVFAGILAMILGANLLVAKRRPARLVWWYAGLAAALTLNVLVPLDSFLGLPRTSQVLLSLLLTFAPVLFAGVIFAVSFSRSTAPDRDFGANVAGAMAGGLLENTSMLLGFRYLTLVVAALYAVSMWRGRVTDARVARLRA